MSNDLMSMSESVQAEANDELRRRASEHALTIRTAFTDLCKAMINHFGEGALDPVAGEWNYAFRMLASNQWRFETEPEKMSRALAAENERLRARVECLETAIGLSKAGLNMLENRGDMINRLAAMKIRSRLYDALLPVPNSQQTTTYPQKQEASRNE